MFGENRNIFHKILLKKLFNAILGLLLIITFFGFFNSKLFFKDFFNTS